MAWFRLPLPLIFENINFMYNEKELLETIRSRMDESRFLHTLAVAEEVKSLGLLFSLEKATAKKLYLAGLLHDITKVLSYEEHIALAEQLGTVLTPDDLASPPTLHALTGAALAESEFGEIADAEIVSAIRTHTTGSANMPLFSKLLYLADYIEPTRKQPVCIAARRAFYADMATEQDKQTILNRHLLSITEGTRQHILKNRYPLHPKTVETIESLKKELAK